MKQGDVRRLVPDEHPPPPTPAAVDFSQRLAESQHTVVAGQVEGLDRLRIADRAVVGIVEQQREPPSPRPLPADGGDQLGVVPFMDDDEIGAVTGLRDIEPHRVDRRAEFGIGALEGFEPPAPVIGEQPLQAPGALRLIDLHLMAAIDQVAQDAAQEVGVAMVPAGGQRVGEVDDPHAAASLSSAAARASR